MLRKGSVLVVDDEDDFRENVAEFLGSRKYEVLQARDARAAMEAVEARPVDAATVDIVMPGMDGLELLARLHGADPLLQVVMITGQATVETAVSAMRQGAYDYITKPVRMNELELVVRGACEKALLRRQNRAYQEEQRVRRIRFASDIVACSPAMRKILHEAEGVARTDLPVLLEGETGVGKGVIAEFIHSNSDRHDFPLTVLDCGALPEGLLEAELFGHEKGAFTGATAARVGMLEIADKGTLLFDEIGDVPLSAQTRLLRFLEHGVFRRLGARVEKTVDVRVLAATNHDLARDVEEGRFREDLYHRLVVYRMPIPPLRERSDDILPLADSFIHRLAARFKIGLVLSDTAKTALSNFRWPGNVRELAHTIERGALCARLAASDTIEAEHLRLPSNDGASPLLVTLEEAERRHVKAVLDHFDGNRRKAAEVLGISERHLYRKLNPDRKGSSSTGR